jgi:hypothetical protein
MATWLDEVLGKFGTNAGAVSNALAPAVIKYGIDQLFPGIADPRQQMAGYQGGIPSYGIQRERVPFTYDPARRPGSSGQRYFTDVRYVKPGQANPPVTDAAALAAMNLANPARRTYADGGVVDYRGQPIDDITQPIVQVRPGTFLQDRAAREDQALKERPFYEFWSPSERALNTTNELLGIIGAKQHLLDKSLRDKARSRAYDELQQRREQAQQARERGASRVLKAEGGPVDARAKLNELIARRDMIMNRMNNPDSTAGYTVEKLAAGGIATMAGGKYLTGATDGMADRVKANIDGRQEARLSDGEFVIPADVVSHLGNGNSDAGAKVLFAMMDKVRKARTGKTAQGTKIDPNKYVPA